MADSRTPAISCERVAVPAGLESPRSKLLSVTLAATGGTRLPVLRSALGTSSLSRYRLVRDLRDAGIVERADDGVVRLVDISTAQVDAH